jgi:hypothetical protein
MACAKPNETCKLNRAFVIGPVVNLRIRQVIREEPVFMEVAKTSEIERGKMKSAEAKAVLANTAHFRRIAFDFSISFL